MNDDAQLLQRLGALAQAADPVPQLVTDLGRAAFALRRLDDELAELVGDSDVELVGVRSGGSDVRLLTFHAADLVVEAQVSAAGDRHTVLGQVVLVSVAEGTVHLESANHGGSEQSLDELGSFRFDSVRSGLVRLTVQLGDARTVSTTWFTV